DAPDEKELLMRTMLRSAQLPPNLIDYMARELYPAWFKDAPPLVTQAQAGMSQAATEPLGHAGPPHPHPFHQPGQPDNQDPTRNPGNQFRPRVVGGNDGDMAGSDDQAEPPGGRLPPRGAQ